MASVSAPRETKLSSDGIGMETRAKDIANDTPNHIRKHPENIRKTAAAIPMTTPMTKITWNARFRHDRVNLAHPIAV